MNIRVYTSNASWLSKPPISNRVFPRRLHEQDTNKSNIYRERSRVSAR